MTQPDRPAEPFDDEPESKPPDSAETRVGQVVQSLARATRQIVVPNRETPSIAGHAQRERIAVLVFALGDAHHPLHHRAVQDLVAIGAPAVGPLSESLRPERPWLAAYRATEALGQIGDGRAAGALLEALRHPNSNVRWGAIQALMIVGDARTLVELRRVASHDRGKTSWGESVSSAAQSALNQMQERNILLRGADLLKTAAACVLMLVSLILAVSVVGTLQTELDAFGAVDADLSNEPLVRTVAPLRQSSGSDPLTLPTALPTPAATPESAVVPLPAETPTPLAALPDGSITGVVLAGGNVRAFPVVAADNIIGSINAGDQIIFLAATADRFWFRIQLGELRAESSRIDSLDGSGWVSRSLLSEPEGALPVEQP